MRIRETSPLRSASDPAPRVRAEWVGITASWLECLLFAMLPLITAIAIS